MDLKNKSTDELRDLLEQKKAEKDKPKSEIPERLVTFIQDFGLREGGHFCPNYLLYSMYCNEWYPTGKKVSQTKFSREMKSWLPYKRKTKSRGFLINKVFKEAERVKAKEESLEQKKQREVPEHKERVHTTE